MITSRQKPPLRVVMLSRAFYERRTLTVARNLLGKYLVRRHPDGTTTGRIVETEAYIGPNDRASHASRGRTPRTALMFGPAGFAYVYLIYGVYHCLNIVTEREGFPSAVLLRAIEPVEGLGPMRARRKRTDGRQVAGGPGKLCQAFAIDLSLNGVDMCGETLYVEDRGDDPPAVVTGSRIGVDYAGPWRDKPWRFCIPDNPHLSRTIGNPVRKRKS